MRTISITFHSLFLLNGFLSYPASIAGQAISLQIHGPCDILIIYRLCTTEFLTYILEYSGSTLFKPSCLDDQHVCMYIDPKPFFSDCTPFWVVIKKVTNK